MKDLSKTLDIEGAGKELTQDRITIGMATCGLSAGAGAVYDALLKAKLKIPIEKVGCIGMCFNEPIVTVVIDGKKTIYGNVDEDDAKRIAECIRAGRVCKESFIATDISKLDFYKKQKRLIMENCGYINPMKLEHYVATGGYGGLIKAIDLGPEKAIQQIQASGLRGRGGAGFPTGKKWSFIAGSKGKKYIIGNGDEGDPGAFMNRTLIESDPFRIIEGITIGAFCTGCDEGFIYTRAEYPLAIQTLEKAIELAYKHDLLGKNILGKKGFNFDLSIKKGAGAFVCGEETALIHSIEGKRGSPTPRPPYPAAKGVYQKPSNVNNVGTLGHVATIMKIGAEEYAKTGTEKTKGTKVICLTGNINRTGVIEVPMGTKLKDIVFDIGGGTPPKKRFKALLTGGPAGGCIPKEKLDTPLDFETMRALGSMMGSGGIVVITDDSCIVDIARFFLNFTQQESCGKCTPCREGTKRLLESLQRITRGEADEDELKKLRMLAEFIRDNSLCGLGQGAPNPVLSTLEFFEKEYIKHVKDKTCPAHVCTELLSYFITDRCVGCGACARACPANAITGKPKQKHVIEQKKCIKCGTCFEVCPVKAIDRK